MSKDYSEEYLYFVICVLSAHAYVLNIKILSTIMPIPRK